MPHDAYSVTLLLVCYYLILKSFGHPKWRYMARCYFLAWLQVCFPEMAS